MNRGRTPGWTDPQNGIALCAILAAVGGLLAGIEGGTFGLIVFGLTVLCALIGLVFDGFIGLVVGLVFATAAVLLKRRFGVWNPDEFATTLGLAACLFALGWAAGLAATQVRRAVRGERPASPVTPVDGSLGLLTDEYARLRLDDEIARARAHHRALGVLIARVRITDPDLSAPARRSAERAVARLVESLLRGSDVPFALSGTEFGAILPETDPATGWNVVGPLVDAASRATFTDRATGVRRQLSECAELHTNLVFLTEETEDGDELIERARADLDAERGDSADPDDTRILPVIT